MYDSAMLTFTSSAHQTHPTTRVLAGKLEGARGFSLDRLSVFR